MNERPDLFIGLIGAVGTTLSSVVEVLRAELSPFGYGIETIRLSDILRELPAFRKRVAEIPKDAEDDRIKVLMDCGNELRAAAGHDGALFQLAVRQLVMRRSAKLGTNLQSSSTAYIFWSLKHPGEIETLRRIYKSSSHVISVYAPRHVRRDLLATKIGRGKTGLASKALYRRVDDLIDRDQNEADSHGQNVRDAFGSADFFVDATKEVSPQIGRYIRLLFGDPFITPTLDEYGMFHAKAAALRSADLSRQVGAMALSSEGSHLAAGCNEVPKAGGGHFWPGRDDPAIDDRDFRVGLDKNVAMRADLLREIIEVMNKKRMLRPTRGRKPVLSVVEELLFSASEPNLRDSKFAAIIEYGRIVHAEMSAITDAARRGVSLGGAHLICTTFPCHMCTRLIIAAGIAEVVYIEPYPKSLAAELYGRSIRVDDEKAEHEDRRVHFRPFMGVSPRRYIDLFNYKRRKDQRGFAIDWNPRPDMEPIFSEPAPIYMKWEAVYGFSKPKNRRLGRRAR